MATPGFDDTKWTAPAYIKPGIGPLNQSMIGNVKTLTITPKVIGEGNVAEVYGYERDNASARFFLSDLECKKLPAQGIWKRYDLGRVRLFRPKFVMDLPEGAIVEFAYSEYLTHGRVQPWITLSASDSYNFDHIVAKGGAQEFFPLTPKGGRFVEIHVFAPLDKIKFIEEKFIERSYYGEQEGSFKSNDELINTIWQTGVETLKACAEDAIIDNPTRERGQWLGDGGIVGMQIANVAFSDLRVCKRGLTQSAQCAREDGLVSGLFPGGGAHLSTYAAHWVLACMNYWRFTGDKRILKELFPAAEKNMAAFQKQMSDLGIKNELGWGFVDWGYISNEGLCDIAVNLHYYLALQEMIKWSNALDKKDRALEYTLLSQKMSGILNKWFQNYATADGYQWDKIGYHRAVLAMLAGFIPKEKQKSTIEFIKKHILNCFPNNPSAPRLSDPNANNPQLITPYFANYAFTVLIENGEMDFVMDQYRKCWGWALEDGRTTWLEVFDTRWSHSHHWSGCPTWQLTRYALGLKPAFDKGQNAFDFTFYPGSLQNAEGKIPLNATSQVSVNWKRNAKIVEYEINTPEPIWVNVPANLNSSQKGKIKVDKYLKLVIK
jgi:alpha-L-rhamnosidase